MSKKTDEKYDTTQIIKPSITDDLGDSLDEPYPSSMNFTKSPLDQNSNEYALSLLNKVVSLLDLPEWVCDDTAKLYRRCYAQLAEKYQIAELVAGALYLSLRTWSSEVILFSQFIQAFRTLDIPVRKSVICQLAATLLQLSNRQIKAVTPQDYIFPLLRLLSHNVAFQKNFGKFDTSLLFEVRTEVFWLLRHVNWESNSVNPLIHAACALFGALNLVIRRRGKLASPLSQSLFTNACGIVNFAFQKHFQTVIQPLLVERLFHSHRKNRANTPDTRPRKSSKAWNKERYF